MKSLALLLSLLLVGFYVFVPNLTNKSYDVFRLSPKEKSLTMNGNLLREFGERTIHLLKTHWGPFRLFPFFEESKERPKSCCWSVLGTSLLQAFPNKCVRLYKSADMSFGNATRLWWRGTTSRKRKPSPSRSTRLPTGLQRRWTWNSK